MSVKYIVAPSRLKQMLFAQWDAFDELVHGSIVIEPMDRRQRPLVRGLVHATADESALAIDATVVESRRRQVDLHVGDPLQPFLVRVEAGEAGRECEHETAVRSQAHGSDTLRQNMGAKRLISFAIAPDLAVVDLNPPQFAGPGMPDGTLPEEVAAVDDQVDLDIHRPGSRLLGSPSSAVGIEPPRHLGRRLKVPGSVPARVPGHRSGVAQRAPSAPGNSGGTDPEGT
jgi:hypothetical protein